MVVGRSSGKTWGEGRESMGSRVCRCRRVRNLVKPCSEGEKGCRFGEELTRHGVYNGGQSDPAPWRVG